MKKNTMKVVLVCAILILALVLGFSGLRFLESAVFLKPQTQEPMPSKVIVHGGKQYFPRQDITTMMFLGIQKTGKVSEYNASHDYPVDMICLLIFHKETGKCDLLTVNPDIITTVSTLDESGKESGQSEARLAMSYTYGSGGKDSCENTRKAVSELLGGVNIDCYFSVNADAIVAFNDALGGVTVNVTDDFSQIDPTVQMGKVTLTGQQVLTFLQSGTDMEDPMYHSREDRQKEYMKGFTTALGNTAAQGIDKLLRLYDEVMPYMVTDCSISVLSKLMGDFDRYEQGVAFSINTEAGTADTKGLRVDNDALRELVLDLFYEQIN